MGTSACKARGSSCGSSLSACVVSRLDGDLDPAADGALGGAFSTPPDAAEHAEIARLIEAITRPPPNVLDAGGSGAQEGELDTKVGKPQLNGNSATFAHPSAAQRLHRGRGTGGGLSVQELSAVAGKARAWPQACSADSILEMVELEDDTPLQAEQGCLGGDNGTVAPATNSRERASAVGSREAVAGDGSEDDPWGLGIPGLNVVPLEGAIQAMAARLAMSGGNLMPGGCNQPGEDEGRESTAPPPTGPTASDSGDLGAGREGAVSISRLEGAVKPPELSSISENLSPTATDFAQPGLDSAPRKCGNGSICIGQWTNGHLDGYGIERWHDGSVFIGDFRMGHKHGYGRMTWASGCTYEGEFARDSLNGEGLHVWNDGRGFSGQWINNSAGPRGTVRWSDGRLYRGEFFQGHMHGRGTFYWPDGRSYCGQWQQGRQHGSGVATHQRTDESKQESDASDPDSLWRGVWREGELIEWLGRGCDPSKVSEMPVAGPTLSGRETPELCTPRAATLAGASTTPPPLQLSTAGWSPDRATPIPTPRSPAERATKVDASPRKPADVLRVESCSTGICKAAENFQL